MKRGFLLKKSTKTKQNNDTFTFDNNTRPPTQPTATKKNAEISSPVSSSLLELEDKDVTCETVSSMFKLHSEETGHKKDDKTMQDREFDMLHSFDYDEQDREKHSFKIRELSSRIKRSNFVTDIKNVDNDPVDHQDLACEHAMVDSNIRENDTPLEINFLALSRALSVSLMQMKRNKNEALCQEFISAKLENDVSWMYVWKLLLHRIAKKKDATASQMAVAMSRKDPGIRLLYQCLRDSQAHKLLMLGAALFVSDITMCYKDLLSRQQYHLKLFSLFVTVVNDAKSKRTVLAHECMMASYRLISSQHMTCINKSEVLSLLQIQEQWYKSVSRHHWRRSCAIAVIHDWRSIIENSTDSTKSIEGGNIIELVGLAGFGGLCQTLVDSSRLEVSDIQSTLRKASTCWPQQRTIIRGITAAFHQDKKLWSDDSTVSFVSLILPLLASNEEPEVVELSLHLLICLLQNAAEERIGELVNTLLSFLADRQDNADVPSLIGKRWRISLIEGDDVSPNRYSAVLTAISTAMFRVPDQMTTLVFFGLMVDAENPVSCRVAEGIKKILCLCVEQLERSQNSDDDIYLRLAPLLLIRRVRTNIWQATWKLFLPDCSLLIANLTQLGKYIRRILNTEHGDDAMLTSERKLAAEIAGICLPFSKQDSFSSFTMVCLPAFRTVASFLEGKVQSFKNAYRPAKAALYAACCQVALAQDNAEALKSVFSFALWITQVHNEDTDLFELQRGCIDFFAACLQVEVSTNKKCLVDIVAALRGILQKSSVSIDWLDTSLYEVSLRSGHLESMVLKTCVLNSYLLVSKDLSEEVLRSTWAKSIGPWVLDLVDEFIDKSFKAPLLAALQILFVLVTRTNSLDPIGHKLRKANRCILRSLTNSDPAVRMQALKFLLSVIYLNYEKYEKLGQDAIDVLSLVKAISRDDGKFRAIAEPIFQLNL